MENTYPAMLTWVPIIALWLSTVKNHFEIGVDSTVDLYFDDTVMSN